MTADSCIHKSKNRLYGDVHFQIFLKKTFFFKLKLKLYFTVAILVMPDFMKLKYQSELMRKSKEIWKFLVFVIALLWPAYLVEILESNFTEKSTLLRIASGIMYLLHNMVSMYDHFTLMVCKIQNVRDQTEQKKICILK